MSEKAIYAENLTKKFRSTEALRGLSFSVPKGSIYGLLGPNGAGKTTTIKILMNLLTAHSGQAVVLGHPSDKLGWKEFQKIGYVSENQLMPEDMTVFELLSYLRPYYPTWDDQLCQELLVRLDLPLDRRLKNLSRGMKMKANLLSSVAFHPELLVLDEPFSGLDPVVRDNFTQGLLGSVVESRSTVFLSSHDVEEVERLCDWVGIMWAGQLPISEPLDQLLRRFRQIDLTFDSGEAPEIAWGSEVIKVDRAGGTIRLVHQRFNGEETRQALAQSFTGPVGIEDAEMTLRDIYLALNRAPHPVHK